ncbi:MAG: hypothetical protein ACRYGR_05610 [Janthinobacterium lividum]
MEEKKKREDMEEKKIREDMEEKKKKHEDMDEEEQGKGNKVVVTYIGG